MPLSPAADLLDATATWVVLIDNSGSMAGFEAEVNRVVSDLQKLAQMGRHTVFFASLPDGFLPLEEAFGIHPLVRHDRHDHRSPADLRRDLRQERPSGRGVDLDDYLERLFPELAKQEGVGSGPLRVLLIDDFAGPPLQTAALRRAARTREVSLVAIALGRERSDAPRGQREEPLVHWCAPHALAQWMEHPSVLQLRHLRKAARSGRSGNVERLLAALPTARAAAVAAAAQSSDLTLLRTLWPTTAPVDGGEILEGAAEAGRVAALDWLLPHITDPSARARALKAAAGAGQTAALERLLAEGASPDALAGALVPAVHNGHPVAVHRLLEAAPVSSLPPAPLFAALEKNVPEVVAAVAVRTDRRAAAGPLAQAWFRQSRPRPGTPPALLFDTFHEVSLATADALAKALAHAGWATAVFRRLMKNENTGDLLVLNLTLPHIDLLLPHVNVRGLRWAAAWLDRKGEPHPHRAAIEGLLLEKTLPATPGPRPVRARL